MNCEQDCMVHISDKPGRTCYPAHRIPKTLLEACLFWTDQQGGTIHEFLPRLRWKYRRYDRRMECGVWHLVLDGAPCMEMFKPPLNGRVIGWYGGDKTHLPKIEPALCTGHLDRIGADSWAA